MPCGVTVVCARSLVNRGFRRGLLVSGLPWSPGLLWSAGSAWSAVVRRGPLVRRRVVPHPARRVKAVNNSLFPPRSGREKSTAREDNSHRHGPQLILLPLQ